MDIFVIRILKIIAIRTNPSGHNLSRFSCGCSCSTARLATEKKTIVLLEDLHVFKQSRFDQCRNLALKQRQIID